MRWLAHGEPDVPSTRRWMSTAEQQRLASFRFTKPHREYLVRRWTAKQAVAETLGLDRQDLDDLASIEIRNRPSGAPYAVVDGQPAPVDVSLTDRAGWAVCLVSDAGSFEAGTLGVDLEIVERRSAAFVDDFLTAAEADQVRAATDEVAAAVLANLMWSAKEAALKVLQLGLRVDTQRVAVRADPDDAALDGWRQLSVTAQGQTFPGYWRHDGSFLLTVCFAESHRPAEPPRLLSGSSSLGDAVALHTWQEQPTVNERR